jgi:hypothetical protein
MNLRDSLRLHEANKHNTKVDWNDRLLDDCYPSYNDVECNQSEVDDAITINRPEVLDPVRLLYTRLKLA